MNTYRTAASIQEPKQISQHRATLGPTMMTSPSSAWRSSSDEYMAKSIDGQLLDGFCELEIAQTGSVDTAGWQLTNGLLATNKFEVTSMHSLELVGTTNLHFEHSTEQSSFDVMQRKITKILAGHSLWLRTGEPKPQHRTTRPLTRAVNRALPSRIQLSAPAYRYIRKPPLNHALCQWHINFSRQCRLARHLESFIAPAMALSNQISVASALPVGYSHHRRGKFSTEPPQCRQSRWCAKKAANKISGTETISDMSNSP